jgi:hypothetical protein
MLRCWFRSLTLVVAAALLLSSQCYALCSVSACNAKPDCTTHCHHNKSHSERTDSGQVCRAQHPEFLDPERGAFVAKFIQSHASPAQFLVSADKIDFFDGQTAWCCVNQREFALHSGTSVFALLSTLRI